MNTTWTYRLALLAYLGSIALVVIAFILLWYWILTFPPGVIPNR